MPIAGFLEALGPYARVGTAVAPFVAALVVRFILGKNRLTDILVTLGTCWLFVNVLIAPYSVEMQRDLHQMLRH
jgi:hypothetical protein